MNKNLFEKKVYAGTIQAVVLDWAGTIVDYGCMGPAAVFLEVYNKYDIQVSQTEARQFMGLAKKDHIRAMCKLDSIARQWQNVYQKFPTEDDIEMLYKKTVSMMVETIASHSEPIPGALETIQKMKSMNIKIGSCTGYVKEIMDVLVPLASQKGFHPDSIVCSSDVPQGRPFPWMCLQNAILLETYPMEAMVKIGDTVADIEEGLSAGMWTIGITKTGNELGMTQKEIEGLALEDLQVRLKRIESKFKEAGAHFVVETISDCLPVIDTINQKLANPEP